MAAFDNSPSSSLYSPNVSIDEPGLRKSFMLHENFGELRGEMESERLLISN
jgi:hypothetical protein